jgi:hypothetical protein
MNSIETAGMAWIKTAFFGTILLFILLLLSPIPTDNYFIRYEDLSVLIFPISFLIFIICFCLTIAWSGVQFVLTIYTLEYIRFLNKSIRHKTTLIATLTFLFSLLTAASFSLLIHNSYISTLVCIGVLPYIPTSVIIMYREATIFYNQDKIP